MTRTVFYACPAFVGSVTGPTTCAFWPGEPAQFHWGGAIQIPIDLGKNPQAARNGKIAIAEIQADDYLGYSFGGGTGIGPMWPGGVMNAMCWIQSDYWAGLAPGGRQPPRVPTGAQCHDYELTSVLYWDGDLAGRRFNGMYAEILQTVGTISQVKIWQPGTSLIPGQAPLGTYWLDLSQLAHPVENGFTAIATAGTRAGALFLDTSSRNIVPFDWPKIPRTLGGLVHARRRSRAA